MKVLFLNSIFPNTVEPSKGNFVAKNIAAYPKDVQVKVVAPIPLFLGMRRTGKTIPILYRETVQYGAKTIEVYRPKFLLLPRNLLRMFVPYLEYLFIRRTVIRIAAKWKIDVLHANFASPDGIAAAKLSKELKIPLVITEHQASLEHFLMIKYLRKQMLTAYAQANKVICVSAYTEGIIKAAAPMLGNLVVIPNGVDFARFGLRHKKPELKRIIYVGYLVRHKGVHVLLQALASLKQSGIDLQLTVVGSGVELDALKQLAEKLGIASQVQFVGEKSASEVTELLTRHDAMVHPSFIESFGIVLVEALAAGLPVVSTFNGGAQEIVAPQCGVLVPINDAEALAKGIKQVMANWGSYRPEELRSYAANKFSLDAVAARTIDIYKEVLCNS